jgi:hypothetical protein
MPRALALVRPGPSGLALALVLTPVLMFVVAPAARGQPARRPTPQAAPQAGPRSRPRPAAGSAASEIRPCRPDSALHREATQALAALGAQIEALAPAADPGPASTALTALLAHPCLRLADLDLAKPPTFDSAVALKDFWKESGADWLQAYLDHAKPGAEGGGKIVVPAAPRPTLSRETHPGHDLTPLLCSLADAACAVRTRGWALRAGDAVEQHDYLSDSDSEECGRKARSERPPRRYEAWRACIEAKIVPIMALPLGGLNAPADGWLVIHGRRGHYEFCDEIRAYDLATGSAYVAQRCDGLIRMWTGEGAVPDAGQVKAQAGQVVRENLRETAWMMLLAPFVGETAARSVHHLYLPDGIELRRSARIEPRSRVRMISSDQTELAWSYVRQGAVMATGTLTWPTDYADTARAHAVRLLEITEAAFAPGCPRAVLPAGLISTARLGDEPGVSPLDASAGELDRTALDLAAALEGLRTNPAARGCAAPEIEKPRGPGKTAPAPAR